MIYFSTSEDQQQMMINLVKLAAEADPLPIFAGENLETQGPQGRLAMTRCDGLPRRG